MDEVPANASPADTEEFNIDASLATKVVKMAYVMGGDVTRLVNDGTLPTLEELTKFIRQNGVTLEVKRIMNDAVHVLGYSIILAAMDEISKKGLTPQVIAAYRALSHLTDKKD